MGRGIGCPQATLLIAREVDDAPGVPRRRREGRGPPPEVVEPNDVLGPERPVAGERKAPYAARIKPRFGRRPGTADGAPAPPVEVQDPVARADPDRPIRVRR